MTDNVQTDRSLYACRYDQASLAILKQLHHLESLIKAPRELQHPVNVTEHSPTASHHVQVPYLPQQPDLPHENRILYSATSPVTVHSGEDLRSGGSIHSQYSFSPAGDGSDLAFDHDNATGITRGTDTPPSSATLSKASSEMSIEAMLRWPIFEQRLGNLSKTSLIEDLGKASTAESFASDGTRERAAYEVLNLDRNTVSQLIENFLINNLPSNPILDPVSLRRDGQEVVDSGLRWDGKSCLIVNAQRRPPSGIYMSHILTSLAASRPRHWQHRNLYSIPPAEWAHLVGSERACVQSG